MAILLQGWAGDHDGQALRRLPNRLLIAITTTERSYVPNPFFKIERHAVDVYPEIAVKCMTPNAMPAVVTGVEWFDSKNTGLAVVLAQVDDGRGLQPWASGIHLFSLSVPTPEGSCHSSVFATALIDDDLVRVKTSDIVDSRWGGWGSVDEPWSPWAGGRWR